MQFNENSQPIKLNSNPLFFLCLNRSFVFTNYQPRQCNTFYNRAFMVEWSLSVIMTSKHVMHESESPRLACRLIDSDFIRDKFLGHYPIHNLSLSWPGITPPLAPSRIPPPSCSNPSLMISCRPPPLSRRSSPSWWPPVAVGWRWLSAWPASSPLPRRRFLRRELAVSWPSEQPVPSEVAPTLGSALPSEAAFRARLSSWLTVCLVAASESPAVYSTRLDSSGKTWTVKYTRGNLTNLFISLEKKNIFIWIILDLFEYITHVQYKANLICGILKV